MKRLGLSDRAYGRVLKEVARTIADLAGPPRPKEGGLIFRIGIAWRQERIHA